MLPRCGRAAHICGANYFCNKLFLLQLHFKKLSNSNKVKWWEVRLQIRTRQRGNCSTLAGKSRGGTPFCRMLKIVFFRSIVSNSEPQANKKFFDPAIFQKCWRGSGRVALIAARRQRNPRAMLLAHGEGGEKSESFSRRGEQDRPALWNLSSKQISCNCSGGTVATEMIFLGKPIAYGSAESLRCLPLCCSPVGVLSELLMNLS